jgi:hypothetical protein
MDGATVNFVLTRFEAVDGARLEVEGRWTGVRGMRFVRPALVVHQAGGERTLLAVLDHKPWPAEEGQPWLAAFPWQGGDLDPAQAELAVAPSIVVPLAEPDPDTVADPQVALRHRLAEAEDRTRRLEAEVGFLRREREERPAPEVIERDQAAAESARATALTERDAAVAARQAAVAERDEAVAERDALREQLRERQRAAEGAAAHREQAVAERDAAVERVAEVERDAEVEHDAGQDADDAASRAAEGERDRLRAEVEEARRELEALRAEREEAPARPAAAVPARRAERRRPHEHEWTRSDSVARTAAVLAVLVLLLLAITFLKAL